MSRSKRSGWQWLPTRNNQLGLLLLALPALMITAWSLHANVWIDQIHTADPTRVITERIDPNLASSASLRRLPLIGSSRAQAIIAYRQQHTAAGRLAFTRPNDLLRVKDIGPGVLNKIRPYLCWPKSPQPQPAAADNSPAEKTSAS